MTDQNTTAAEAVERKKTGDWRDAIGVLKGHFPEGMKSEDIMWCERSGMRYDEFIRFLSTGMNPRDYESPIQAHTAYLWERAMQPDVVEATAKELWASTRHLVGDWTDWEVASEPDRESFRDKALYSNTAALTLLLGPRPEGARDAK